MTISNDTTASPIIPYATLLSRNCKVMEHKQSPSILYPGLCKPCVCTCSVCLLKVNHRCVAHTCINRGRGKLSVLVCWLLADGDTQKSPGMLYPGWCKPCICVFSFSCYRLSTGGCKPPVCTVIKSFKYLWSLDIYIVCKLWLSGRL